MPTTTTTVTSALSSGVTTTVTTTEATPEKVSTSPVENLFTSGDAYCQCLCGKTIIRCIGQKTPGGGKAHLACGCCDCRAALDWCYQRGGPRVPDVVDGTYWPNDFEVTMGKENLKAYLLREGMCSNRLIATCCNTCLLVDHPFYAAKVALCLDGEADDAHRFKIMKNYIVPPCVCRVSMRDCSDEQRAAHPPSAVGVAAESDYMDIGIPANLEAVTAHFGEFMDFELTAKGKTIQQIIAECGPQLYMGVTEADTDKFTLGQDEYRQDLMNRVIIPNMEAEAAAAAAAE